MGKVLLAIIVIPCKFHHQTTIAGRISCLTKCVYSSPAGRSAFIIVVAMCQLCVSSLARGRTLDGCAGELKQHDGKPSAAFGVTLRWSGGQERVTQMHD